MCNVVAATINLALLSFWVESNRFKRVHSQEIPDICCQVYWYFSLHFCLVFFYFFWISFYAKLRTKCHGKKLRDVQISSVRDFVGMYAQISWVPSSTLNNINIVVNNTKDKCHVMQLFMLKHRRIDDRDGCERSIENIKYGFKWTVMFLISLKYNMSLLYFDEIYSY